MKKSMLLLMACTVAAIGCFANSMTIHNTTPCYYYASTQAGYIWITPAGTPGANQFFATGNYFGAKVIRDNIAAYQIAVGTNPPAPINFNQIVYSVSVGDFPTCNNGNMYKVTWTTNNVGDATLSID